MRYTNCIYKYCNPGTLHWVYQIVYRQRFGFNKLWVIGTKIIHHGKIL